jgi:two-component system, NtrC family, sensor kinase
MKVRGEAGPTLRRRMVVHIGLMVLCSLMIGVGAIFGIDGLHEDMGVAVQGYHQLRQVYEVGFEVALARDALSASQPDDARALTALQTAELRLDPSYDRQSGESPPAWLDETKRDQIRAPILVAVSQLNVPNDANQSAGPAALSSVNDALGRVSMLSSEIRTTIVAREAAVDQRRHLTFVLIAGLSAAAVMTAVVIGMRQYRGVVAPLDRLGRGVRRFAAGRLSERIAPDGDHEFAALARDFNDMAGELESLCRDLQQKVETKSRELSRSERLASVGYLAAGVAHEINNPLSIITGYGERSLRLLDRTPDEETLRKTRSTIGIICEEAFRCKQITDRLLSLARPGTDHARPVSLVTLVEDVVENIGGLPEFADRRIILQSQSDHDLSVLAKDGEIKQVVINLLLNALEAVDPSNGHVEVTIRRLRDEVELSVRDDGRGIPPQTLERVFEPFFTDKRGDRPGMGLGLSISHAIVVRHGGSIVAESEGPGRGSRFVVRLPAAEPERSRT